MVQSSVIQMHDLHSQTFTQLQAFLNGATAVDFTFAPAARYGASGIGGSSVQNFRHSADGRLCGYPPIAAES